MFIMPTFNDSLGCKFAIETLGAVGPHLLSLLKDIGRRITSESGEAKSREYLIQCLSVAVQRGNATSVSMGT